MEATSDDPIARTDDVHSQDIILSKIIVSGRLTDGGVSRSPESTVQNFKRFRRVQPGAPPGNSYEAMIPFAKEPHRCFRILYICRSQPANKLSARMIACIKYFMFWSWRSRQLYLELNFAFYPLNVTRVLNILMQGSPQ